MKVALLIHFASELARQEFPELTVENDRPFRSLVVCKIRLLELVKIVS